MQSDRLYGAGVSCHCAIFYLCCDLAETGQAVVEELFVAVAEVALGVV